MNEVVLDPGRDENGELTWVVVQWKVLKARRL